MAPGSQLTFSWRDAGCQACLATQRDITHCWTTGCPGGNSGAMRNMVHGDGRYFIFPVGCTQDPIQTELYLSLHLFPLPGREAPGCGWVMAEAVRGVREPCTPQSGVHTSRVQVTWRTTDSRGSAGAGQQDHVRGRDGCSGAQTHSWCRGCWAQGCSAHLWPGESAGHFSQISICGWTASWASGNLPSCSTPGEAWPLNDCVVGVRLTL